MTESTEGQMQVITILIPVFNEAASITGNLRSIQKCAAGIADARVNLLIVDDGSSDGLQETLAAEFELGREISLLTLNHNFGKEAAIQAGLSRIKSSDAVVVMDSDLQHPPELLPEMVALWRQGCQVVNGCKMDRGEESLIRKISSRCFYAIFDRCTGLRIRYQSDYKLLDKTVVELYLNLPERDRFFRGLLSWMNLESGQVYFEVPKAEGRATSWKRLNLLKYAIRSITSFTSFPLQIVTLFGFLTFLVSLVVGGIAIYDKLAGNALEGFVTVILLILFIGSILMFSLGLIGIYIAKIYDEVKRRPAFMIHSRRSIIDEEAL